MWESDPAKRKKPHSDKVTSRELANRRDEKTSPLEVSHLPSIWQSDFYETQIVASAFGTITRGSNDVSGLERVLVPPIPGKHGRALSFTAPLFDHAFFVLHI